MNCNDHRGSSGSIRRYAANCGCKVAIPGHRRRSQATIEPPDRSTGQPGKDKKSRRCRLGPHCRAGFGLTSFAALSDSNEQSLDASIRRPLPGGAGLAGCIGRYWEFLHVNNRALVDSFGHEMQRSSVGIASQAGSDGDRGGRRATRMIATTLQVGSARLAARSRSFR
jgi:hypothetical protein